MQTQLSSSTGNLKNRVFNFSPGPATLPVPVLEEASKAVLEIGGTGMSVLEVSHRGGVYEELHQAARARMLKVMGLSADEYTVLFIGGGASLQFAMLPMNIFQPGSSDFGAYIHTGEWSSKAIKEAKKIGQVKIVASSEERKFSTLPALKNLSSEIKGAKYLHITTNNTIEGTQYKQIEEIAQACQTADVPLVADASSDLLWGPVDYSKFSFIYAGAQKNLGPAGVTIVVARKSFLEKCTNEKVPTILNYKEHAKADSLYNTPPAFNIYVVGLVLQWIEQQGGVGTLGEKNKKKAGLVYESIDRHSGVYEPAVASVADRSLMNITFRLRDASKEKDFLDRAKKLHLEGLKGHRSVGGFRASIYNAFPIEGCQKLAEFLDAFAKGI